ncbi:hypothetical protein D3C81_1875380 [compost metagenome]
MRVRTSSRKSTLLAEITLTLTGIGTLPPMRTISFCCKARSSLPCASSGKLPISSRNNVPFCASSNLPIAPFLFAPVNEPET